VQNGIVTGSDVFIDRLRTDLHREREVGTADRRDSVLFAVIVGKGRYDAARSFNNPELFDLVYIHKFSDRLTYTLEVSTASRRRPRLRVREQLGVVQYLTYQFTPRLSGTARLEFLRRRAGPENGFPAVHRPSPPA